MEDKRDPIDCTCLPVRHMGGSMPHTDECWAKDRVDREAQYQINKEKWLKVFSNVRILERNDLCTNESGFGPVSWWVVWLEVDQNTETGKALLRALDKLGILK